MKKRGEGKVEVHCGRVELYRYYKNSVKGKPERFQVSQSEHSKVLNMFNKAVVKEILENSFEFILPRRLGIIRIKKYKPTIKIDEITGELKTKGLSIDFKATKKLWEENPEAKLLKKKVYFVNNHSDGYQYTWYYSTYRSNLPNKSLYRFIPTRSNKRALAKLVKNPNFKGDFFE